MMPRWFTGMGIDLSDHHLRLARVNLFGVVEDVFETELPEGLVQDDRVIDPKELSKQVLGVCKKNRFACENVRTTVLIPESRVFATSLLFNKTLKGSALEHQARELAQKEMPLVLSESRVTVSTGAYEDGKRRTTVYAVDKQVYDNLLSTFVPTPMHLMAMEANSKALLRLFQRFGNRSLQQKDPKRLIGIVDIGSVWTTISVYTYAGSNVFSRTVSHRQDKSSSQSDRHSDKTVDIIRGTLDDVMLYFSKRNQQLSLLLFAGVEGQDERLLEIEVKEQSAKTSVHLLGSALNIPRLGKKEIHIYGAAIGASLRSAFPRRYVYQHNFYSLEKN